jgi:hypothetical protein
MKKEWEIDWKFFRALGGTYQGLAMISFCVALFTDHRYPDGNLIWSSANTITAILAGWPLACLMIVCVAAIVLAVIDNAYIGLKHIHIHIHKPIRRVTKPVTQDLRKVDA